MSFLFKEADISRIILVRKLPLQSVMLRLLALPLALRPKFLALALPPKSLALYVVALLTSLVEIRHLYFLRYMCCSHVLYVRNICFVVAVAIF